MILFPAKNAHSPAIGRYFKSFEKDNLKQLGHFLISANKGQLVKED